MNPSDLDKLTRFHALNISMKIENVDDNEGHYSQKQGLFITEKIEPVYIDKSCFKSVCRGGVKLRDHDFLEEDVTFLSGQIQELLVIKQRDNSASTTTEVIRTFNNSNSINERPDKILNSSDIESDIKSDHGKTVAKVIDTAFEQKLNCPESIAKEMKCSICRNLLKRAMRLKCDNSSVCWGCGVKEVTKTHTCWSCGQTDISTNHLYLDSNLRELVKQFQ